MEWVLWAAGEPRDSAIVLPLLLRKREACQIRVKSSQNEEVRTLIEPPNPGYCREPPQVAEPVAFQVEFPRPLLPDMLHDLGRITARERGKARCRVKRVDLIDRRLAPFRFRNDQERLCVPSQSDIARGGGVLLHPHLRHYRSQP